MSNQFNFKYTVETPRLFNTEVYTDDLEKEQHKEISDCWQALMKEVV